MLKNIFVLVADIKSAIRLFKKTALNIWNDIAQHKHAAIFMHPVKEEEAPGYHSLILRPMDLNTIKVRIRDGVNHFYFKMLN